MSEDILESVARDNLEVRSLKELYQDVTESREVRRSEGLNPRSKFIEDGVLFIFEEVYGTIYRLPRNDTSGQPVNIWQTPFKEEDGQITATKFYFGEDGIIHRTEVVSQVKNQDGEVINQPKVDSFPKDVKRFGKVVKVIIGGQEKDILSVATLVPSKKIIESQKSTPQESIYQISDLKKKYNDEIVPLFTNASLSDEQLLDKCTQWFEAFTQSCQDGNIEIFDLAAKAARRFLNTDSYGVNLDPKTALVFLSILKNDLVPSAREYLKEYGEDVLSVTDQRSIDSIDNQRSFILFRICKLTDTLMGSLESHSMPEQITVAKDCLDLLYSQRDFAFKENMGKVQGREVLDSDLGLIRLFNFGNSEQLASSEAQLAELISQIVQSDSKDKVMGRFSFDGKGFLQAWYLSSGDRTDTMIQNLAAMTEIEKSKKGALQTLAYRYGIMNFGRYPTDILLDQLRNQGKKIKFGTVVYPTHDWNGAAYENKSMFHDFYPKLRGLDYYLVVTEIDGQKNGLWKLNRVRQSFGESEFGLIGAHGSVNAIEFDPTRKDGTITLDDILIPDFPSPRLSRVFRNNPTIILSSCSTGIKGGIAEGISRQSKDSKPYVIGPVGDTSLKKVTPRIFRYGQNEQKLEFAVEYYTASTNEFSAGVVVKQSSPSLTVR